MGRNLKRKKGGEKGDKEKLLLRLSILIRHIKAFLLIQGNLKLRHFHFILQCKAVNARESYSWALLVWRI